MDLKAVREYFDARIKELPNGCWEWIGPINREGEPGEAPRVHAGGATFSARKVSWILDGGLASDGPFRVNCGNSRCVCPDHLVMSNTDNGGDDGNFAERLSLGFLMESLHGDDP